MSDYSISVLLASLFPFLPSLAGASARTTWAISSGVFAVGSIAYYIFNRALIRDTLSSPENALLTRTIIVIDGVMLLALSVNASGLVFEPSLTIYFAVLYWFLAGAHRLRACRVTDLARELAAQHVWFRRTPSE